jgi:hypothetical protein
LPLRLLLPFHLLLRLSLLLSVCLPLLVPLLVLPLWEVHLVRLLVPVAQR